MRFSRIIVPLLNTMGKKEYTHKDENGTQLKGSDDVISISGLSSTYNSTPIPVKPKKESLYYLTLRFFDFDKPSYQYGADGQDELFDAPAPLRPSYFTTNYPLVPSPKYYIDYVVQIETELEKRGVGSEMISLITDAIRGDQGSMEDLMNEIEYPLYLNKENYFITIISLLLVGSFGDVYLPNGETFLITSIRNGDIFLFNLLLKITKVSANKPNSTNLNTPLHYAAKSGNLSMIGKLLPFSEIDAKNSKGKTALHVAIENCHYWSVVSLTINGSSIHEKCNSLTALELAKSLKDQEKCKDIIENLEKVIELSQRVVSP